MRRPNLLKDGWALEDGEALNRAYPDTFEIPHAQIRENLRPGDLAKLVFRLSVDNQATPEAVERMWVIVTATMEGGYLGVLDNEPDSITKNGDFWLGAEVPFEPRHVISAEKGDADTVARAAMPAPIPWKNPTTDC